ncbi:exonuclease domain-containing protein [Nocardia sp. NPDC088792]|uniref:exonuclease domain-containing protein n=1 Tax=Nocardia sp. NPDC088792 TaxID=3364332 RepID=UPI0037F78895
MGGMSFAAIDVETANSARGSVCAVGVAVVRDGRRVVTESWLCRPPEGVDFFSWHNIRVHGISAVRVAGEPTFGERWPEVLRVVDELPVIAHNAGFDSSAIREACGHSGIRAPEWEFACSLAISRRHLDLESYRLPNVAEALGIARFSHHDAAADAAAAADIVLALAERTGAGSLTELERAGTDRQARSWGAGRGSPGDRPERAGTRRSRWGDAAGRSSSGETARRRGEVGRSSETVRPSGERRERGSWFPRTELVMPEVTGTDPDHPLYGQIVVFTGDLVKLTRQQAWDAIAACGAQPARNVTRRTTCLVIGDGFTGGDPAAFTTTKAARVVQLRAGGHRIEVLDEQGLLARFGPAAESTADSLLPGNS